MDDRIAGWLLALAAAALFAGAVRADRRAPALGFAALLLLYLIALAVGASLLPGSPWAPVLAALAVWLAVQPLRGLGRLSRADLGLAPAQPGSAGPAMVATLVFIAGHLLVLELRGTPPAAIPATLFGLAIAAAFAEELVMRGILLALADRASPPRWRILGAPIGWGGITLTFAFITLHGARPGLLWGVAPAALLYLWLRARTGSLLPPIVAHLLWNLAVLLTQR